MTTLQSMSHIWYVLPNTVEVAWVAKPLLCTLDSSSSSILLLFQLLAAPSNLGAVPSAPSCPSPALSFLLWAHSVPRFPSSASGSPSSARPPPPAASPASPPTLLSSSCLRSPALRGASSPPGGWRTRRAPGADRSATHCGRSPALGDLRLCPPGSSAPPDPPCDFSPSRHRRPWPPKHSHSSKIFSCSPPESFSWEWSWSWISTPRLKKSCCRQIFLDGRLGFSPQNPRLWLCKGSHLVFSAANPQCPRWSDEKELESDQQILESLNPSCSSLRIWGELCRPSVTQRLWGRKPVCHSQLCVLGTSPLRAPVLPVNQILWYLDFCDDLYPVNTEI